LTAWLSVFLAVVTAAAEDDFAIKPHPRPNHIYPAELVRVVDGDTFELDIDLGFGVRRLVVCRLAFIDAWETRGEERPRGLAAKKFATTWLANHKPLTIRGDRAGLPPKTGKFGRWILDIHGRGKDGRPANLAEALVDNGHAERATY